MIKLQSKTNDSHSSCVCLWPRDLLVSFCSFCRVRFSVLGINVFAQFYRTISYINQLSLLHNYSTDKHNYKYTVVSVVVYNEACSKKLYTIFDYYEMSNQYY